MVHHNKAQRYFRLTWSAGCGEIVFSFLHLDKDTRPLCLYCMSFYRNDVARIPGDPSIRHKMLFVQSMELGRYQPTDAVLDIVWVCCFSTQNGKACL